VREFAELLLKARGQWDEVVERYVHGTTLSPVRVGRGGAA